MKKLTEHSIESQIPMKIEGKLREIFFRYAESVQSKLRTMREVRVAGTFEVHLRKSDLLNAAVDELENGSDFRQLIIETQSVFMIKGHGRIEQAWKTAVKNFFRRSGFYIEIQSGQPVDNDAAFSRYCEAFRRQEMRIQFFAPMELVYFSESEMDFCEFEIKRFSAQELSEIFQNNINEIFYPWAKIDLDQLKDFWLLHLTEKIPVPKIGKIDIDLNQIGRVDLKYTRFPASVERVLQVLALFDWMDCTPGRRTEKASKLLSAMGSETRKSALKESEEGLEEGWSGFNIPFILRVNDDLLHSPATVPNLSTLQTIPDEDPNTGVETEIPLVLIHLDREETKTFKESIHRVQGLFRSLNEKPSGWDFLDVARGNFIKAFFAGGFEQLLLHITTLEALLGENREGLTNLIARRLAVILGRTEAERQEIKKVFKKLYDFRSDLVHGNSFDKIVFEGHLRQARDLTRRTLLWFLHYLTHLKNSINVESLPGRNEILIGLDQEEDARTRLKHLIESTPSAFPYIEGWTDYGSC